VVLRCLDAEEVYEAIDWRVIVLLAGVLPLGIALQKSGAADFDRRRHHGAGRQLGSAGAWPPSTCSPRR
jgi:hypothetical protein